KFLKVSRIVKRRTVAKEICVAGRVKLNDHPAKAGSELNVGDKLEIVYGSRLLEVQIKELRENVSTKEATNLYTVLRDERKCEEEW
ncbi:MAG: S4 domain-containing protein, partial [Clostridiales bacterium]|nr:S4 domain-containing protein [Clostridiales bacterium]